MTAYKLLFVVELFHPVSCFRLILSVLSNYVLCCIDYISVIRTLTFFAMSVWVSVFRSVTFRTVWWGIRAARWMALTLKSTLTNAQLHHSTLSIDSRLKAGPTTHKWMMGYTRNAGRSGANLLRSVLSCCDRRICKYIFSACAPGKHAGKD